MVRLNQWRKQQFSNGCNFQIHLLPITNFIWAINNVRLTTIVHPKKFVTSVVRYRSIERRTMLQNYMLFAFETCRNQIKFVYYLFESGKRIILVTLWNISDRCGFVFTNFSNDLIVCFTSFTNESPNIKVPKDRPIVYAMKLSGNENIINCKTMASEYPIGVFQSNGNLLMFDSKGRITFHFIRRTKEF